MIPVVVRHRSDIGKMALDQLRLLAKRFHSELNTVVVPFEMDAPKSLVGREETSQRSRSFLFTAVGGVVAWASGSSRLEIYELGIGAINAPLLAAMHGSQATRSTHPEFLLRMSRLLSLAAERQIEVCLPFKKMTKGEVVRTLNADGLREIVPLTASCVHYPLRQKK